MLLISSQGITFYLSSWELYFTPCRLLSHPSSTLSQYTSPPPSHCFCLFHPPRPTVSLSVSTMEVPTKWSRASVISFIKGLGKRAGLYVHVHACLPHLSGRLSHKQVVYDVWGSRGLSGNEYLRLTFQVRSGHMFMKGRLDLTKLLPLTH